MMRKTNYKVAFAHLTSRVKQVLVAVLSVTFGISMYIFMNSFMSGVNDTQTELAFSTLSHIHIYRDLPEDNTNLLDKYYNEASIINLRNPKVIQYKEGIKNADKILNYLKNHPDVTHAAPQVNINVFFRNGSTQQNGLLSGIDADAEDKLFGTAEFMVEGHWEDLNRNEGLILGSGLAKKLSLTVNDHVTIMTSDGLTRNYKVIGILETTLASVDNGKAYIKINEARRLINKNRSYASDIQVNITDFDKAKLVASSISPAVNFKVESWMEANGQLEASNELRNMIAIAVSLTILLVAGFGIYNIMNMTVNEKIKEIAILKAMGFEGNDIVEIFLIQSMIIGLLGGLVGMALGYTVSYIIDLMPFQIASLETLPIAYNLEDYLSALVFGLVTTFLAGYLPAKKASKVDPVDIIRG